MGHVNGVNYDHLQVRQLHWTRQRVPTDGLNGTTVAQPNGYTGAFQQGTVNGIRTEWYHRWISRWAIFLATAFAERASRTKRLAAWFTSTTILAIVCRFISTNANTSVMVIES